LSFASYHRLNKRSGEHETRYMRGHHCAKRARSRDSRDSKQGNLVTATAMGHHLNSIRPHHWKSIPSRCTPCAAGNRRHANKAITTKTLLCGPRVLDAPRCLAVIVHDLRPSLHKLRGEWLKTIRASEVLGNCAEARVGSNRQVDMGGSPRDCTSLAVDALEL